MIEGTSRPIDRFHPLEMDLPRLQSTGVVPEVRWLLFGNIICSEPTGVITNRGIPRNREVSEINRRLYQNLQETGWLAELVEFFI